MRTQLRLATAVLTAAVVSHSVVRAQLPLSQLTVAVDGAKTPDLIPDALAYDHFLKAISTPIAASPQHVGARNALLARMRLSQTDGRALILALTGVWDELNRIDVARRSAPSALDPAGHTRNDLATRERALLDSAKSNLLSALSPEGAQRVDAFVRTHVKRRIKVYGSPAQQ